MAYEVTATRRRPQDFDSLVGQEFVAATLKNAIQSGKIAHAYLFSGPRGCGKTSSARILAKALNCQQGPAAQPCGQCTACQEITRGASLDVIEIDGASNTSVNDIRQIKDEVLFPPNSCRYKIYIIDEVHMLSTSAFNALLKTIEEPPPYVIFIFATTELHKVPATIKSRCQQFHFRLVAVEQLKELLAQAAAEIGLQAEDEALYWIAREATGSVRDAYTLFDQVASFSGSHITFEKIRETLGLVGLDTMNQLFESCVASNTGVAVEQLDALFQGGISIEQFITDCCDYLRSLLLIKAGITKESLLGQSPERYSPRVLSGWGIPQLERALSLFLNLYRDIRYSTSPRYEVDLALSRLCGLTSFVPAQEVFQAVEQARRMLAGAAPQAAPPTGGQQGRPNPFANGGAVPPEHRHHLSDLGGTMVSLPKSAVSSGKPQRMGDSPVPEREPGPGIVSAPERVSAPRPASASGDGARPQQGRAAGSGSQAAPVPQVAFVKMPPPGGGAVPKEGLREKLVEELSIGHTSTASVLLSSDPWVFADGRILIAVGNSFALNQLQKDKELLSDLACSFTGQPWQLEFKLRERAQANRVQEEWPVQVDILCRVFKGTVLE